METGIWKSPVVIEMYGRPGSVIITGTLDAALMLIGAWPTKRTEAHISAVLSCRDVLTGRGEPGLARINFIEAAIEAGYRIEPETFLSDRWDLTPLPEELPRPALGLAALIRKRAQLSSDVASAAAPQPSAKDDSFASPQIRSAPQLRATPPPLRELLGRLLSLLGQIGLEFGWLLTAALTLGMVRRTGRQAH